MPPAGSALDSSEEHGGSDWRMLRGAMHVLWRQGSVLAQQHSELEAVQEWGVERSKALYNCNGWGAPYFSINADGHLIVRPTGAHRRAACAWAWPRACRRFDGRAVNAITAAVLGAALPWPAAHVVAAVRAQSARRLPGLPMPGAPGKRRACKGSWQSSCLSPAACTHATTRASTCHACMRAWLSPALADGAWPKPHHSETAPHPRLHRQATSARWTCTMWSRRCTSKG